MYIHIDVKHLILRKILIVFFFVELCLKKFSMQIQNIRNCMNGIS
jgi:hypothetical protein